MKTKYKYIGAEEPALPSNRFVNPVFEFNGEYYNQVVENEKIMSFSKTPQPTRLVNVSSEFTAEEGEDTVYSFITSKRELVYGSRSDIELHLLRLMDNNVFNSHTKLIISSFLKLYAKSIEYVKESNEDFHKRGVSEEIDESKAIFEGSEKYNSPVDVLSFIKSRYKRFRAVSKSINPEDIAYCKRGIMYMCNSKIDIDLVINKNTIGEIEERRFYSQIITIGFQNHSIQLDQFINLGKNTYEFLLKSEFIDLDQNKIENLLSTKIQDIERIGASIIDIGLNIDKEMYESNTDPKVTPLSEQKKAEMSLTDSVNKIIDFFTNL